MSSAPAAPGTFREFVSTRPPADPAFVQAAIAWFTHGSPHGFIRFEDQPAIAKAIWTLDALATSLGVSGTMHFLRSMGPQAYRIGDYARMVGAPRTTEYAAAMLRELKRLNRGRLPANEWPVLHAALDGLERRDEAAGGAGLFLEVDDAFSAAVTSELGSTLQTFAVTHADDVDEAFRAFVRPTPPMAEATRTDTEGDSCFSTNVRDYDERARAWITRAAALTVEQLAEVGKRYRKGAAEKARAHAIRLSETGKYVGRAKEDHQRERKITMALAVESERTTTAALAASSLSPKVQQAALQAKMHATSILIMLPELERAPGGRASIDAALAAFEGIIPAWNVEW